MKKDRSTQDRESFDQLLQWLGPNRETAGIKYEEIRSALINIFVWRHVPEAEDLADETIIRVAGKVSEIAPSYIGDPALYFYGVAKRVLMEYQRRRHIEETIDIAALLSASEQPRAYEAFEACLDESLNALSPGDRDLILSYYRPVRSASVSYRKKIASKAGLAPNALRVRIHRIRSAIEKQITACLENMKASEFL